MATDLQEHYKRKDGQHALFVILGDNKKVVIPWISEKVEKAPWECAQCDRDENHICTNSACVNYIDPLDDN